MKLAIIAPTSIPSRRANTLQVMKMSQAFANLGHEVNLIIPDEVEELEDGVRNWDSLAHHYGLSTEFEMEWLPVNPRLRKYDFAWYAVNRARTWEADIIYTRLPPAAAFAATWGLSTILEVHDRPQGKSGPLLFQSFLRGRGAKRLILISSPLAADLQDKFGSRIRSPFMQVNPDGVDLERYSDLPEPDESRRRLSAAIGLKGDEFGAKFFPERFTAGYTGHLYPGRGISLLLEIAGHLPQVNFLIVGGEPKDVAQVHEEVMENNLKNVVLTGFIPNSDLPMYQAACNVLMMPYQQQVSASSGGNIAKYLSPMKLFEYLACGRVICASDLPVFRDVLSAENAILLPPGEASSWVSALLELIKDPSLREDLAANAKKAASEYTWEKRASTILAGV
jgi:glycosyltransferase involved in cell wall biosynthesis